MKKNRKQKTETKNREMLMQCCKEKGNYPNPLNSHTVGERERILREVVRCPLYYRDGTKESSSCGTRTTLNEETRMPPPNVTQTQGIHNIRNHQRVRGIEELVRVARSPHASELTTRRRVAIETTTPYRQRHAEHFRLLPPLPASLCRVPATEAPPGVPRKLQLPPCIPGQQRVDYSNPTS